MASVHISSFGALLRRHRLAAGLSQEALAERAGLSARAVSDLERGLKKTPRRDTVELLAGALALSDADRAALEATIHRRRGPPPRAGTAPTPALSRWPDLSDASSPWAWPPHPAPLVGRDSDVASVAHLLHVGGVRLLTLTGPGGVGKTRLALQVATEVQGHYADGILVVSLAALREPALLAATIARACGLREAPGRSPAATLTEHLRDRETLLVLDNMEHLVAAGPLLADLLAACARLTLLLTSRVALRLREEHLVPVPPLALPDPQRLPPVEVLAQVPAVALFLQRARQIKPDFALTPATAPIVARICRRLDGLPLAIELAAARVRLLPPAALLRRLEHRLDVLTAGAYDLPQRQHTLRDTIAWSYDLLDPAPRVLFRRLAVFAGGCTVEAAEVVCAAPGDLTITVLDGLDALVDHSLLRVHEGADGDARVEMLETLREYGLERLAAGGEEDAIRGAHAAYYLALAEQAEPLLLGPAQDRWLARLEDEHNNLRAALDWARAHPAAAVTRAPTRAPGQEGDRPLAGNALGLRLAGALWRFWYTHGHLDEGRAALDSVLAAPATGDSAGARDGGDGVSTIGAGNDAGAGDGAGTGHAQAAARAKALHGAGTLAHIQSDYERAAALYEESLLLRRRLGDRQGIADSLNNLGVLADIQGDYLRARDLYEECLALRRALGHRQGIAAALHNLAMVVHELGDRARAMALYEESLALERESGNKAGVAASLFDLALLSREQGDWGRTTALCEESLLLHRELNDKRGSTHPLLLLAQVARRQGDYPRAATLDHECMRLRQEVGDKRSLAECLEEIAGLAAALHDPWRAAQLGGAAAALREEIGAPLPPTDRAECDVVMAGVRAALGDAGDAAWTAGRALPLAASIPLALAVCEGCMGRGAAEQHSGPRRGVLEPG